MTTRRRGNGASWNGDQRDGLVDNLFVAMRDRAQSELGRKVSIATDAESSLVGLPLPALCLRYLFQSTTYPLSRIMQITGEEGSAKSAFLYEVFRWHFVYGGGCVLAENENKDSTEMRNSILAWNPAWMRRMEVVPTYSLEQWQQALTMFTGIAREQQDAVGGPGRTIPIAVGIDSLMATAPQSEIDSVNADGHSSRGFALAANLISRYMRTMPERLQDYPFSVIGTNHLKPATDFMGRPTAQIPGGKAVKFMETYEIEMHKSPSADIDLLEYGGLRIKFIARKNSLGPSRKAIQAELLWWWQDIEGVWRQQSAWDWDTATIELLLSFENAKGKRTLYNRLMEICDLQVVNKGARTIWSRTLGIPQDAPVLYRQAGVMLENRPDLLTELYKMLGVAARRPFQPGVDYRALLQTAEAEAHAVATNLYANMESLPVVTGGESFMPEVEGGASSEERADWEAAGEPSV